MGKSAEMPISVNLVCSPVGWVERINKGNGDTQAHLNTIHRHITSKMERNPTLYAKMFASVSRDRWVSLSIFGRVGTWAGEVLFLKGESPGPIRSTQPTRNELLKLNPMGKSAEIRRNTLSIRRNTQAKTSSKNTRSYRKRLSRAKLAPTEEGSGTRELNGSVCSHLINVRAFWRLIIASLKLLLAVEELRFLYHVRLKASPLLVNEVTLPLRDHLAFRGTG